MIYDYNSNVYIYIYIYFSNFDEFLSQVVTLFIQPVQSSTDLNEMKKQGNKKLGKENQHWFDLVKRIRAFRQASRQTQFQR